MAGIATQIAENVRGEVNPAAEGFLSNAIGYSVGREWSSILQPLADVLAIVAMVLFSTLDDDEGTASQARSEVVGVMGVSTLCWATLLAASIFERTLLHLPYFVLALVSLQVWASRLDRAGFVLLHPRVRNAVLVYTTLHLLADYLMQVPLLRDSPFAISAAATGIGLRPLPFGSALSWLSSGLRLLLFIVYSSVRWGIWSAGPRTEGSAAGQHASDLVAPLLPHVDDADAPRTSRPLLKPVGNASAYRDDDEVTAALNILSTGIRSLCKITLIVSMLAWSLAVHSVLSMPLLLSVFVMSKMDSRRAFTAAGYVLLYSTLFLTAQYVYDTIHPLIADRENSVWLDIGLRPFDQYGVRLALQCAAALPLAIAARVGSDDISSGVLLEVSASMRRFIGLFSEPSIVPSTPHPTDESRRRAPAAGFCARCFQAVRMTWLLLISLLRFGVLNLQSVALLTIYSAGLSRIDLIHSGYVAFCLLFVLCPRLTKFLWVYLLAYCELALAAFYIWQFSWVGEGPSGASITELLGLQYNATCTEITDPDSVFGDVFVFSCWDYVGLPAFAAVVASIQLSIFRGASLIATRFEDGNRLRRGSVEAGANRLLGSNDWHLNSVADMETKLIDLYSALCTKFGHYLAALVLIVLACIGPSTGIRAVVLLAACTFLVLIQAAKSRRFGNGSLLLLHITMAYLYAIILIKYVYKFPQIQEIVSQETGAKIIALQDIGLIGGDVYFDLLPETIAMALIATIVKQRQSQRQATTDRLPDTSSEQPAAKTAGVGKVLWQWVADQSIFGDLLAATLLFGVGCYRLSAVHYLYFVVGLFTCCFGRLPGILWSVTFVLALLHMMAIYALQFQVFEIDQYNCIEESNWRCCAVWFGARSRSPGDPVDSFSWDLFLPLIAIASLDIHRRFHSSLADSDSDGATPLLGESAHPNAPTGHASLPEKSSTNGSSRMLRAAIWFRDHATLSVVGLNFCYGMLVVATIVDSNVMSIIYTLLIFMVVVNNDGKSPKIWIGFSIVFGVLLAARYAVYLGVPPCVTDYRLPFRQFEAEWRTWLGLANPCVTNNETFDGCAVYDFTWDCAVLFVVTAFARASIKNKHKQNKQGIIVGYGRDWISHLHLMMWDVGLVNGLTIGIFFLSYWHYNLFTLGYAVFGIALLHERDKLTEDTAAITLLMAYAGLVLLIVAAFQCPVFTEGMGTCINLVTGTDITAVASNSTFCLCEGCNHSWQLDETSFQSVLGLHKYSERTSDLWAAAICFLISMALRGTVQSKIYKDYILPMAEHDINVDAKQRHRDYLSAQIETLVGLDEREAKERTEREEARKRLHQEHSVARRRERLRSMTPIPRMPNVTEESETQPEPEPEPTNNQLGESVEADVDGETEQSHLSRLHELFTSFVDWLHNYADPLIHDKPMLSEDAAMALVVDSSDSDSNGTGDVDEDIPSPVPSSDGRRRSRTQKMLTTMFRAQSHVIRVAKVGTAHSLVLCQTIWYAIVGISLQLCCAMISLGFVAHRDVISCILFATLFGYCLPSSKSIAIGYWRAAIRTVEIKMLLVKFLTAWPTQCIFSLTTCDGGWPGDGPGLDIRSHQRILDTGNASWIWDLALLLSLLLHRQHLRRRGEWFSSDVDTTTARERIDEICEVLSRSSETASGARGSTVSDNTPEPFVPDEKASNMERASRIGTDTYMPMFLAQALVFCISPFLYADLFGEELQAISEQLNTSSLRWQLILLVFGVFLLIVFDLIVYLCKSLRAKLVLQWLSCMIFVVFFFWWTVALSRRSTANSDSDAVQISTTQWLMAAAFSVYLYQSAIQVASGYPRFQGIDSVHRWYTRNTKGLRPSILSAQRAIPFVTELVYIIEWLCTDTTLSLYDYIRVEEIYILLFQGKVFIDKKAHAGGEHGETQPFYPAKLTYGVGGLVGLIGVLWAPLFLFSTANPFSTLQNDVQDISVTFDLRTMDNANLGLSQEQRTSTYILFTATSASFAAAPSDDQLEQYDPFFRTQLSDFLGDGERDKIQRVSVDRDAAMGWQINPPARMRLEDSLSSNSTSAAIRLRSVFTRRDSALQTQIAYSTEWSALTKNETDFLFKMIANDDFLDSVLPLPNAEYPLYLRLPEQGAAVPLGTQRTSVILGHNVSISEREVLGTNVTTLYESWSLYANRTRNEDANGNGRSDSGLLFVLISDKIATGIVTSATSMGAVVFYGTVVIAVGRLMRGFVAEIVRDAIYRDPDKVEELMALCEDMFAARFLREFGVEEDLHDELRDVFRNFERLYRYTTF